MPLPLHPLLSALHRNRLGAALIAIQIALTVAVLSNALFVIRARVATMSRATGVDERELFAMQNVWVRNPQDAASDQPLDLAARAQSDLAALRSLPGVSDAYVTNSYPLSGLLYLCPITLKPRDERAQHMAGLYFGDEHALQTLGVKLVAGRNFRADEVVDYSRVPRGATARVSGFIITQALARQLAPDGERVLGRLATLPTGGLGSPISAPIIGIVQTLQVGGVHLPDFLHLQSDSAVLLPYRFDQPKSYYLVRVRSAAALDSVMAAATRKLYDVSRLRVLQHVQSLTEARRTMYRADRGQAVMLTAVSAILMAMTGWGIVGLTSCWVTQRRRQIGIRRALGATRPQIVRHFQLENLLIAGIGIGAGVALAMAGNVWMVSHFAMPRLVMSYLVVGAVIVVVLGQLAALWPALRAAAVPPAEVTRNL